MSEDAGPAARFAAADSVISAAVLPASPGRVWNALAFYEQLAGRPPWLLRALLPTPVRTDRRPWAAGVETRCFYETGWVVKRLTRVEPARRCEFEVVRQGLEIGRGIRLVGGRYVLTDAGGGGTRLELETLYASSARPRRMWRALEAAVCRVFHRHILESVRLELERGADQREPSAGAL